MSIAHTRWATHGPPSIVNCHPLKSDPKADFTVVHNGIVTNAAALRTLLQKRGYQFESDTDTEAVAILTKYIYDSQPDKRPSFTELIKTVLKELEGSFAFVFKSAHYPNEAVTARRGSPLLIGVKTERKLKVDFVDVEFPDLGAGKETEKPIDARTYIIFDMPDMQKLTMRCSRCSDLPGRSSRAAVAEQPHAHPVSRVHVGGWHASTHRVFRCLRCCCHH